MNSVDLHNFKSVVFTLLSVFFLFCFLYFYKLEMTSKLVIKDNLSTEYLEVNFGYADNSKGQDVILNSEKVVKVNDKIHKAKEASSEIEKDYAHTNANDIMHNDYDNINVPLAKNKATRDKIKKKLNVIHNTKTASGVKNTNAVPTKKIISKDIPQYKAIFNGFAKGISNNVDNKELSQGDDKFENGVKGQEDGKSNTGNYEGVTSDFKVSNELLDRGIIQFPKFDAEFNINAKIKVEIRVDEQGNSSFVRIIYSNTADKRFLNIVKQKLKSLKFKSDDNESFGFIEFNFKLNE